MSKFHSKIAQHDLLGPFFLMTVFVFLIYSNTFQSPWILDDYNNILMRPSVHLENLDGESLWKSIKTKKLLKLSVGFGEIDYYDNMTDMYEVPYASIERGLKKARIGYSTHGSIPKEWSCDLAMRFADTSANTPIMEAIKKTLGSTFTPEIEKEFAKKLKKVLQKKERYASYHYQSDDND